MDKIIRNVIIFAAVILIIAAVFIGVIISNKNNTGNNLLGTASSNANSAGTNTAVQPNGEVQNVKLSVVGGSYVLTPSVLKKDIPVRLEADLDSLKGCSRDVVISAFGVRKYVKAADNVILFTPTKTGTINIACSMNMYRGTFTVVDNTNSQNAVASTNTQGIDASADSLSNTQAALSSETANTNVAQTHTCGGSSGGCGGGCTMATGGSCGCGK